MGVSTGPSIGQRTLRTVAHALRWLISRLAHASGAGSLVAWLLVAGLIIGFILLARRFGLGVVPERRERGPFITQAPLGAAEWRRLAEEAMAAGDRVGAVRCLYHAIAASLDAQGVVAAGPALTAGEFRSAARDAAPLLAEPVGEAIGVFERAVYALREPDDEEVEAVVAAERRVRGA